MNQVKILKSRGTHIKVYRNKAKFEIFFSGTSIEIRVFVKLISQIVTNSYHNIHCAQYLNEDYRYQKEVIEHHFDFWSRTLFLIEIVPRQVTFCFKSLEQPKRTKAKDAVESISIIASKGPRTILSDEFNIFSGSLVSGKHNPEFSAVS